MILWILNSAFSEVWHASLTAETRADHKNKCMDTFGWYGISYDDQRIRSQ